MIQNKRRILSVLVLSMMLAVGLCSCALAGADGSPTIHFNRNLAAGTVNLAADLAHGADPDIPIIH